MSPTLSVLDRSVLAERVSTVERHLGRVSAMLPASAAELKPASNESDAVVLHLWQAVQIVVDLAVSACVRLHLGTPSSYRDAFERLARAGKLDDDLARRLARAAGFRNLVAHAYDSLDLARVHDAATHGPADLRRFLSAMRDLVEG